MGLATTACKFLIILFNTISTIICIALIVFCCLCFTVATPKGHAVFAFVIVVGSLGLLTSIIGCCGVIKKIKWLTWVYAGIMVIIVILTCVMVICYLRPVSSFDLERYMSELWKTNQISTDIMDIVQSKFKCCGLSGPDDYIESHKPIPESCYAVDQHHTLYKYGCLAKLIHAVETFLKGLSIFSYTLLGVEGVCLVCACILAFSFPSDQRQYIHF